MHSKNLWSIVTLLLLAALVVAACGPATAPPAAEPTQAPAEVAPTTEAQAPEAATAPPEAKAYKLALIQFLKGHPVHRLMQLGFQEGCKELGYECDMLLTDSTSAVDMIPLAEQALAKGYDGVVLYAVDDSFFPTIKKFKDAGIPVVTPHFTSFDQDASGLTAVVGADVVAYAKAAAEAMGAELGGKGAVAVTVGSFNQTENLVAETFKATMAEKYPDVKVLDPQEEGFDQAQAIAKAVAIIQGNPDITGAFSTTGNGPTTWARAAEETSKEGMTIISMDYTRPNLDLVKEGKVYGLVAQPLYEEFYAAAELLGKALDGKPIEYRNLLPAPIITAADLDKYYAFNDRAEAGIAGEAAPTAAPVPSEEAAAPAPTEAAAAGCVQKTPQELGCKYGKDDKCRVVLVNSFLGNDYRIQMQRSAEAASKYPPYADAVDFSILNTENTPEAQRAGLENLLAEGVDAILLNAVDNTSVNDLVQKACDMGVKVVTFDITAKPGACEKAIDFGFCNWAYDAGQWEALAAGADKHPINVIMDKGLQGVDIADDIYQCGLEGMYNVAPKENINIVGEYYGEFAEGVQEPLISAILAANPDKKIDVVHTQGYCTTVKSAFENAGLDYLPIMYCQGYNANAVLCTQEGVNCVVQLDTFAGSIGALDSAYRWMAGEEVPNQIPWPTDFGVTIPGYDITLRTPNAKVSMMETGVNAFPELPPGFGPLYNWPGACAQITVEEAAGLQQ